MLVSCFELNCHNIRAKSKRKSKSKVRASKSREEMMTAAIPEAMPVRGGQGQPQSRSHVCAQAVQVPRLEQGSDVGSSSRTPAATATRATREMPRSDAQQRSAASLRARDEEAARDTTEGKVRKRRKAAHTATA